MVGKNGQSVLCQTLLYLQAGIVVGTVNRLQFNEAVVIVFCIGKVWQLIAIFDKETKIRQESFSLSNQ
jgi:hypothetical protein